jgi:RimJ/RimL family protein N-acetyltransferase
MEIDLHIDKDIYLTKSSVSDKQALIEYLNDEELFNQTLRVPHPYTEQDAENWFNYIFSFESENNIRKNWVIRNQKNQLIGHVGLHFTYGINSSVVEIYYWLGKPYRNRGIITKVIKQFTSYCFSSLNYTRIEAPIFDFNRASENVLLKNGYIFEKDLPNHYTKANKTISAKMYAKTN